MNVKSRGFTLIELMVTVLLMGLVITVGAVSLSKFGSSQKLEEAREGLISSLRLARNYAVTGQRIAGAAPDLVYVTLVVAADGCVNVYQNDTPARSYLNKDISPDGVTITAKTLRFASYDGKLVRMTTGEPLDTGVDFTISAGSGTEDPLTVSVSPSGLINE